jgi:hypothetical protein
LTRCKSGSNDYLERLYTHAHREYRPLKTDKDPLYTPLLGYWNLDDDRPVSITKKDETTYEFTFMTPYLGADDVVYEAQVNTIGGQKFISMKSYKDEYMFFRIDKIDDDNINMQMVTSDVELGNQSLTQYLAANARHMDTLLDLRKIPLQRLTAQSAKDLQIAKVRTHVESISDYELFVRKFPDAPDLEALKRSALDYSLTHASSVAEYQKLAADYPEVADRAFALAKKNCTTTKWCVDYALAFPNDVSRDSIINVGFDKASEKSDYKYLITNFPVHPRTGSAIFNLALIEYRSLNGSTDQSAQQDEYKDLPQVIVALNSIRLFENFQLDNSSFYPNSYVLTPDGKTELDKVADFVSGINKNTPVITDLYFSICDTKQYGKDPSVNFFQAANKCRAVQEYLDSKKISRLAIHVIPAAVSASDLMQNSNGHFSVDPQQGKDWGNKFYSECYSIKQNEIIPGATNELWLDHYIRIPAIEDLILGDLVTQIPLYKKKQAYDRVIPPNYFDPAYSSTQPGFADFNVRLLQTAKANKLRKKFIPLFVSGMTS